MKFGMGSPPLEAAGSAGDNLVKRCETGLRPPRDPARHERDHVALAFSGGGWRAALTAAGVVRFLAEAGILVKVRWISSVSGGSITNGLLSVSHEEIAAAGFSADAVDRGVIAALLGAARERSLTMALLRNAWRAPRRSRTGVLADVLAESMGFRGRARRSESGVLLRLQRRKRDDRGSLQLRCRGSRRLRDWVPLTTTSASRRSTTSLGLIVSAGGVFRTGPASPICCRPICRPGGPCRRRRWAPSSGPELICVSETFE
jgi:hypothetical protein